MQNIKIRAITWNLEGTQKPEGFDATQLLQIKNDGIDICVVGFQELSSRIDNIVSDVLINGEDSWTACIRKELEKYDYIKIHSRRYFGVVILLFGLRKHLSQFRNIESQYTSLITDLKRYSKYIISDLVGSKLSDWPRALKGAVSIRFELYSKSFCVICTHLEAHDYNLDERINEYHMIIGNHKFNTSKESTILEHDYVIWMGDLNFRLQPNVFEHKDIVQQISLGKLEDLLRVDQLLSVQRDDRAFQDFKEDGGGPSFAPTYKFKIGSDVHDKKRCPAWTDRILYHITLVSNYLEASRINSSSYKSRTGENFFCSDHRPVSCDICCRVNSPHLTLADNVDPDSDSIVNFFPNDLGKEINPQWTINGDGVRRLFISYRIVDTQKEGLGLSSWDWIGLFDVQFSSLQDYITFTWASKYPRYSSLKKVSITSLSLQRNCKYILIYVSEKRSILGISKYFKLE